MQSPSIKWLAHGHKSLPGTLHLLGGPVTGLAAVFTSLHESDPDLIIFLLTNKWSCVIQPGLNPGILTHHQKEGNFESFFELVVNFSPLSSENKGLSTFDLQMSHPGLKIHFSCTCLCGIEPCWKISREQKAEAGPSTANLCVLFYSHMCQSPRHLRLKFNMLLN